MNSLHILHSEAATGGGIPEILGNGERGILVDIKSGSSLAEGILTLLQHRDTGKTGPGR